MKFHFTFIECITLIAVVLLIAVSFDFAQYIRSDAELELQRELEITKRAALQLEAIKIDASKIILIPPSTSSGPAAETEAERPETWNPFKTF